MSLPFTSATLAVHSFHKTDLSSGFFRQLNDTVYIGGSKNNKSEPNTKNRTFFSSEKLLISLCADKKRTIFENKVVVRDSYTFQEDSKGLAYLAIPVVDENLTLKGVIYSQIEGCVDAGASIDYISDNWSELSGVSINRFMNPTGEVFESDQIIKPLDTPLDQPFVSVVNNVLQVSNFKQTLDKKTIVS